MATPTIPNGEEHFFPIIYEGNGAGQRVGRFLPFTDQATVANSCIFNGATNNYLSRTPGSNGSTTTLTFSAWVKRGRLGSQSSIFFTNDFSAYGEQLEFLSNNTLQYVCTRTTSGVNDWNFKTNRTFEDTSKWYHILISRDTTNSTQADRVKIYVDGERITSFSTETLAGSSAPGWWNQTTYANIMGNTGNASYTRGIGYLAEVNMIDGQALLPASFGITDTSTGRWIPKTVEPFPTTTTSIAVTVVDSGGNKYALDGVTQGTVTLIEGATYKFDQSDSSNSGHPLRFSTTSNGTHGGGSEYTTGVTTVGTPGSSGAYTQITVAVGAPTLYYYCTNHSGMGGTANTQDQYGTNGFRMKFQDSSALGDDTSGNGNDFSATNLASTDQTTDSPTQNFSTLEGSSSGSMTLSEGNLRYTTASASNWESVYNDKSISSGKWYFELTCKTTTAYDVQPGVILESVLSTNKNQLMGYSDGSVGYNMDGSQNTLYYGNSGNNYVVQAATQVDAGDIVGVAYDADTGAMWFAKNNTWVNNGTGVGNPSTGANPTWVQGTFAGKKVRFGFSTYNSGASSEVNFGQKAFTYTPPTDFKKLQQDNLPETSKGVSGLVWMKNRDTTDAPQWYDSSRGKHVYFVTNSTAAEATATDGLQKFLAGGQQIEDSDAINTSGESFVSWNWVGNGATEVTNTNGSSTTTVQANTAAGFSIVKFTPPSSGFDGITYGHGLTQTPEWILWKRRDSSMRFLVYHHRSYANSNGGYALEFSASNANSAFNTEFGSTSVFTAAPNATTFALRNNSVTAGGQEHMAYCWHGVEGFSKFGQYNANNSTDGPFVYLGFKPKFLIIKSSAAISWYVIDATRSPINPATAGITVDNSQAEFTNQFTIDFLSNGFKIRNSNSGYGASTNSTSHDPYYYMAFAEHPFVGDGTSPVTAR